jgi:hypothetical protein
MVKRHTIQWSKDTQCNGQKTQYNGQKTQNNGQKTHNTMVKRHTIQWSKEKNKRQTMICKTLHRKVKSEQHEPLGEKTALNSCVPEGLNSGAPEGLQRQQWNEFIKQTKCCII